jgi:signal transduction histidine kinase
MTTWRKCIPSSIGSTVSHELRTPLNAISGWAHLLSGGGLSKEQTERAIEIISRNVQIQTRLGEDLLDVSRMTSGKLKFDIESVALLEIVQSSLENAMLAASARAIDLVSDLDRDLPQILGDTGRLRQVVENLLSNAIKFTPTGGTVRVTLGRTAADLELLVEDSGRGISADFLPHIFEAFRQGMAEANGRPRSRNRRGGSRTKRQRAQWPHRA